MKNLNLKDIQSIDTPALTSIIEYWKDYDSSSVLYSMIELKRRDYPFYNKKILKSQKFCDKYGYEDIESFIDSFIKQKGYDSLDELYEKEVTKSFNKCTSKEESIHSKEQIPRNVEDKIDKLNQLKELLKTETISLKEFEMLKKELLYSSKVKPQANEKLKNPNKFLEIKEESLNTNNKYENSEINDKANFSVLFRYLIAIALVFMAIYFYTSTSNEKSNSTNNHTPNSSTTNQKISGFYYMGSGTSTKGSISFIEFKNNGIVISGNKRNGLMNCRMEGNYSYYSPQKELEVNGLYSQNCGGNSSRNGTWAIKSNKILESPSGILFRKD